MTRLATKNIKNKNILIKKGKKKMKKKKIYNIYNESKTTENGEKKLIKILESMMIEARENNKLIAEIEVPINYKPIINDIATGKASTDQMLIYDQIVERFVSLNEDGRKKYRDFVFSEQFRTVELKDLLEIFDIMYEYFLMKGVSTYEELGFQFAMKAITSGRLDDTTPLDNMILYVFGREMFNKLEGFFAFGNFYGKCALSSPTENQ